VKLRIMILLMLNLMCSCINNYESVPYEHDGVYKGLLKDAKYVKVEEGLSYWKILIDKNEDDLVIVRVNSADLNRKDYYPFHASTVLESSVLIFDAHGMDPDYRYEIQVVKEEIWSPGEDL